MEHPGFFTRHGPFKLDELVEASEAKAPEGADLETEIVDVLPLDVAGAKQISFLTIPNI